MAEEIDYKALLAAAEARADALATRAQSAEARADALAARVEVAEAEAATNYVQADEAILTELPPYAKGEMPKENDYTSIHSTWRRPAVVREWAEFDPALPGLLEQIGTARIRRKDELPFSLTIKPGTETSVHGLVEPLLGYTAYVLATGNPALFGHFSPEHMRIGALSNQRPKNKGGICDVYVHVGDKTLLILELKKPSVHFDMLEDGARLHPATVYSRYMEGELKGSGNAKNLSWGILQAYNYLAIKGGTRYGVITNYDSWVFLHRTIENGQEVLELSQMYTRETARLPLAYSMVTAFSSEPDDILVRGAYAPRGIVVDHVAQTQQPYDVPPPRRNPPREARNSNNQNSNHTQGASDSDEISDSGESLRPFFRIGNQVCGVPFTTTEKALGVDNLSVDFDATAQFLAETSKAVTFRVSVNSRDLVYRQVDYYKLPKVSSDFPLEVLEDMARREIEAYQRLRDVWRVLVPEFVYFGHDIAMLWVFVTTYEGVSLSQLADEKGGLPLTIKQAAREALAELHARGVAHGDAFLRNALYRESDRKVLWVDFEFARFSNEPLSELTEDFSELVRKEKEAFNLELEEIPTLEVPPIRLALPSHPESPSTEKGTGARPTKRTKVHCCCL